VQLLGDDHRLALLQLARVLLDVDAVLLAPSQLAFEAELCDEPVRADGALRDVLTRSPTANTVIP